MSRAFLLAAICGAVILGPVTLVSAGWDEAAKAHERGDYATAVRELRSLAEQDDPFAQLFLGEMYSLGMGVQPDNAEAAKWYREAAEQGNAIAQSRLGHMYELGAGVPQDDVQANMWFGLAASRLSPGEMRDWSEARRDKLSEKMTPAQIAEAQKLAREWKPKK